VPSELVFSWLLALSDPAGLRPGEAGPRAALPDGRLRATAFATLCGLADRHGVLPSFLANLKRVTAEGGPDRIVQSAGAAAADATARAMADAERRLVRQTGLAMLLRDQAAELVAALAESGVPALVLKGTDFADRLYPRPGLRLFRDVDILISESARARTDLCLERLGYQATAASLKYASGYGQCGWRRPEAPPADRMAGGTVEIHWDLVNSPSLRRAVSVPLEALQVERPASPGGLSRLSPASMLLAAAVHGATSHAFDRLQVLYDVTQAARGAAGPLDEAWLAEAAKRTGAAFALGVALALAGEVVAEPQCGELLARLRLPRSTGLWKPVLTRGVVLRAHSPWDGLRRQAFRELLKRQ
jgi:hypothetical protein